MQGSLEKLHLCVGLGWFGKGLEQGLPTERF